MKVQKKYKKEQMVGRGTFCGPSFIQVGEPWSIFF